MRNLTFNTINLARKNPSMPYRDLRRPYATWIFSASDAENADAFIDLLRESNQERLEREGGVCIVATHLGKGFCSGGEVREDVKRLLVLLAKRPGWFVPVSPILDELKARRADDSLSPREWRVMQWQWAFDVFVRALRARWRARRTSPVTTLTGASSAS
jgi:hypothetical protein